MMYTLSADASHIEEEDAPAPIYDAVLIEFDQFADVNFFWPNINYRERFGAPEVIEFVGNLENAAWLDHIGTGPVNLLLVSRRFVRVLEAIKPFRYRLIPTTIYSERIGHLVRDPATRRRTWYQVEDPSLRNDDFVILQLLDETDCLDPDRTLVQGKPFHQSGEEYLTGGDADHFAFRAPPDSGFPPALFIPELVFYCFTEEAKQACDKAGLKGLLWRPLP
jgi:hypothetical protein